LFKQAMLRYRDFINAFREFEIGPGIPVIAHASLSAFGRVSGGAQTLVGALMACFDAVIAPTFTYRTMITPPFGPENNGLRYGHGQEQNRQAEVFRPDMPADKTMGITAETLRGHPAAGRSSHPILSFAGVNAKAILATQTLAQPLGPIQSLAEADGYVLLLGVNHTANTSLHHAERLAGRRQFIRWALTPEGVVECRGFPGCSYGFEDIAPRLKGVARQIQLGEATIEAVPLRDLLHIAIGWIRANPVALLCERANCERCQAVREMISKSV
jgi:aminoglycoside 3-N-acetyltransferase